MWRTKNLGDINVLYYRKEILKRHTVSPTDSPKPMYHLSAEAESNRKSLPQSENKCWFGQEIAKAAKELTISIAQ